MLTDDELIPQNPGVKKEGARKLCSFLQRCPDAPLAVAQGLLIAASPFSKAPDRGMHYGRHLAQ